jgi:hypothetical protein
MRTSLWTALVALAAVTVRADTYELKISAGPGVAFFDPWDGHTVVGPGYITSPVNEGFPGKMIYGELSPPGEVSRKIWVSTPFRLVV